MMKSRYTMFHYYHHHHPAVFFVIIVSSVLLSVLLVSFFSLQFFTTTMTSITTTTTLTKATTSIRRDLLNTNDYSSSSIREGLLYDDRRRMVGVYGNVNVSCTTDNNQTTTTTITNCTTAPLEQDQIKVLTDVSGKYIPKIRWADSYSMNGICYCDTNFDKGVAEIKIRNTPIGSITIVDIMKYVPSGPGRIGQPIYNDLQCGNGPHGPNEIDEQQQHCPGRVDHGIIGCGVIGPKWNFQPLQCTTKILFNFFSVPGKKVRHIKTKLCSCIPVYYKYNPFSFLQKIQQFISSEDTILDHTC